MNHVHLCISVADLVVGLSTDSEHVTITDLECLEIEIERANLMPTSSFSKQKARPDCFLQVVIYCFFWYDVSLISLDSLVKALLYCFIYQRCYILLPN